MNLSCCVSFFFSRRAKSSDSHTIACVMCPYDMRLCVNCESLKYFLFMVYVPSILSVSSVGLMFKYQFSGCD